MDELGYYDYDNINEYNEEYYDADYEPYYEQVQPVKRTIKRHKGRITTFGKFTLYGHIFALLASGGLKVYGDMMIDKFENENMVDSTLSISKSIVDKSELEVSKSTLDGIYSYEFDVNSLFETLEPAIQVYNKYKHEPCITRKQCAEKEKAYDDILYSNDKMIEVFNETIKQYISNQLNISPDFIEITYISTDNKDDQLDNKIEYGTVSVSINGNPVDVGKDFSDLIRSYKKGLLITYDINVSELPTELKERKVEKIIDNIKNFRLTMNKLESNSTKFYVASKKYDTVPENEKYDFDISINPKLEDAGATIPDSEIQYIEIMLPQKDKNRQNDTEQEL